MKVRRGFVSNSSSSSFLVAYNNASIEEIDGENVEIIVKRFYDGGPAIFKVDKETKEFIKTAAETPKFKYDVVKTYFKINVGSNVFKKSDIIDTIEKIPVEEFVIHLDEFEHTTQMSFKEFKSTFY